MPSSYSLTLLSQGLGSGPNYVVTYTTGSVYGPVLAGSPAYLPTVGSSAIVTISENTGSFSYLAFKLTNTGTGCNNTYIYTVTGSAPTPSGSCCAPTLTGTTITGSFVQVAFTTGSTLCLSCSAITVETSSNGSTWGIAEASASCTSSYLYPTSSACTGSNLYFRLYQQCVGGVTSSYSATSSVFISGSGQSCCSPSITNIAVSGSVTSSLLLSYITGSGACCLPCSYITIVSSSDGGSTFGGDFTASCGASPVTVVGPPLEQTYYYKIKQTCSGSVTSSFSATSSFANLCTASINVDNNTTTGGLGITAVTVNTYPVTYVSGDNFTIDGGELGTFETNITGISVTVEITYTAHTGTKHINLSDCASPVNSFCDGALNTSGGTVMFEGVEINCGCLLTIEANDGACL